MGLKGAIFMKMNMVNSPNCLLCHEREDNVHLLMECILVREALCRVRLRILSLLTEGCEQTSNFEFLNLMFMKNLMDNEAVWLLGAFIEFTWNEKLVKNRKVKLEQLI